MTFEEKLNGIARDWTNYALPRPTKSRVRLEILELVEMKKQEIISLGEGIRPKKVFSVLINREIFVSEGDDGYNKAIEDYKAKISELT